MQTNGQTNGQTQQPKAAPTSRMTLASVTRGRQHAPLRVVIYGPGGIGKTTFGAQAPAPIFLGPESGSALLDVARFPQPESWDDIRAAVRTLTREPHDFGTLVLDSLDWMEPLCWQHVCRKAGKPNIEEFGYGKGYVAALEEWRSLLADFEAMRKARGMHIVAIAHGHVKPFKNPSGNDYDRWQLKLRADAAGLVFEWADEVCFATFRTHAVKVDPKDTRGTARAKGYGSERVLYTERDAEFDAKSRHGLPKEMPLSWEEFYAGTRRGESELASAIRHEVDEALVRLADLAPTVAEKARAACDGVTDTARLQTYLNTIRARIAEHTPAAAQDTNG